MTTQYFRWGLICLLWCSLTVGLKLGWTGSVEFQRGLAAEAEGQGHEAALHYGRAIHMYLPFSPLASKAGARLLTLAQDSASRGDWMEARFRYEELRSSFLSVRSFYQPGQSFVQAAEEALVTLMLDDPRGAWPAPGATRSIREAEIRNLLAAREDPDRLWVLLMGIGLMTWYGGAALAVLRGIPEDFTSRVDRAALLRWGFASALGYVLWLLALGMA